MKKIHEGLVRFTNTDNIKGISDEMRKIFSLGERETREENITKIRIDNLKFGIYFSRCKKNDGKVLIVKNNKKIRCGSYFMDGIKKEFHSDLYFLVVHNEKRDKSAIFEELMEKILRIISSKKSFLQ